MTDTDAVRRQVEAALDGGDELGQPGNGFGNRLRAFARLENWRRDLEDALKSCKASAEQLAAPLMDDMLENGLQHARVDDLTVFIRTDLVVHKKSVKDGVTTQDVCEALRQCGMGDLVADGYSGASLKAYVAECRRDGAPVPAALADKLTVLEVPRLVARR